jgi:hypothetical protein
MPDRAGSMAKSARWPELLQVPVIKTNIAHLLRFPTAIHNHMSHTLCGKIVDDPPGVIPRSWAIWWLASDFLGAKFWRPTDLLLE